MHPPSPLPSIVRERRRHKYLSIPPCPPTDSIFNLTLAFHKTRHNQEPLSFHVFAPRRTPPLPPHTPPHPPHLYVLLIEKNDSPRGPSEGDDQPQQPEFLDKVAQAIGVSDRVVKIPGALGIQEKEVPLLYLLIALLLVSTCGIYSPG